MNHGTQMTQKDTDLHRFYFFLCRHSAAIINCVNLCPSVSSVCYKKTTMNHLIPLLHEGGFSCVIANQGETRTFTQRGVADLYTLYNNDPAFMQGAVIADKVVGKTGYCPLETACGEETDLQRLYRIIADFVNSH